MFGAVVITRMEENSSVSRTLCYLNRGDSFGELGIIANQPRSATAISEGTVELLAFSEEVMVFSIQNNVKNGFCIKTTDLGVVAFQWRVYVPGVL